MKIKESRATGVFSHEIYSMEIAMHCDMTSDMEDKNKDLDCVSNWRNYKAWLVLREHPKLCDAPDVENKNPRNEEIGKTQEPPPI